MGTTREFAMPSLGADMDDGVIVQWLVEPGDVIERGQIVLIIDTDKSEIEVETFESGVVEELLAPVGARVEVGAPIALLRSTSDHRVGATAGPVTSPVLRRLARDLAVDIDAVEGSGAGGRVSRDDLIAAARPPHRRRVTPRARRLALQHGIDLAGIAPREVVTGDDVLSAQPPRRAMPTVGGEPPSPPSPPDGPSDAHLAAQDSMRTAIATLMSRSWAQIPHFHVRRGVDLTESLVHLDAFNAAVSVGRRILPAAMLLCAVARAAAATSGVNGWWIDGRFEPADDVDLGVVVALRGGGIMAPTIQGAQHLGVVEMMDRLGGVVARARARRLRGGDIASASITVTNLGDLGAHVVHGVIHAPQVALVGFGSIHDEVLAIDGMIAIRRVVHATLAGDHRAFDGRVGAGFLGRLDTALVDVAASLDRHLSEVDHHPDDEEPTDARCS